MIAIVDYGMGNLRSVQKAMEKIGATAQITQNGQAIDMAQGIVLPGVGAMQPAMAKLNALGLIPFIKKAVEAGKPFLGICLGCQLLFDESDEGGAVQGLGILAGRVERFTSLKIPHIGWNQLHIKKHHCPLAAGIEPLSHVYFCHSYFVRPRDKNIVATTTDYGLEFTSAVWHDNVFGVQFHPEKSQAIGLRILKNFTELTR